MDTVEEKENKGPVRIGIGDKSQEQALRKAGANHFHTHLKLRDAVFGDGPMMRSVFRAKDSVIMVQPNLLSVSELREIARIIPSFEVVGHEPQQLYSERVIRNFRQLRPILPKDEVVQRVEGRGAPNKYPVPTSKDVEYILDRWYSGDKRAQVCDDVRGWMKADVKDSWVRDQVIKATGSAKRTPPKEQN